jgi:hypothetical protein
VRFTALGGAVAHRRKGAECYTKCDANGLYQAAVDEREHARVVVSP